MKLELDGHCTACGKSVPVTTNTLTKHGVRCARCRRLEPDAHERTHILLQRREQLSRELVAINELITHHAGASR